MKAEKHGFFIDIELLNDFDIDYDDFEFMANIVFKDMVIYNLRVAGDLAFSKNEEGNGVLIIDLNNPDIVLIEETQQDFRKISKN
jgi:hypothetical protein